MYDILIKNGKVFTGAGNPWFTADVAVKDGRIARVGPQESAEAERVIDAEGLAVSPGFVDMHNHSDTSIMVNPKSESFIRQGVTTLVFPNCGSGAAPLNDDLKEEFRRSSPEFFEAGLELDCTFEEYLKKMEEIGVTGSTCYAAKHSEELDCLDLMINCDGAGRANDHIYRISGPDSLVGNLQGLVDKMNYKMKVGKSSSSASDHWPFYLQGIPAVTLSGYRSPAEVARVGRGWTHTSADTLDKVDPKRLKDAAMVLAHSLIHLANEPSAIAEMTPVGEIVKRLEENGTAEILKVQLKWHPKSIW